MVTPQKKKVITKQNNQPNNSFKKPVFKKPQVDENTLNQMVKERAYFIWEEKGRPAGSDSEIWLQAEKEIRSK